MKKKPPQAPLNAQDQAPVDVQPSITHVPVSPIELHIGFSPGTPPIKVRLGFRTSESDASSVLDEASQMIALATIWLPGALNGGDYAVLQNLFFRVRERLREYFCVEWSHRYKKELWKETRANDVRTWCRVMETYYGGLMDKEALSDPPVHSLSQTDDDALLCYLFSRVYDWFERELYFTEEMRLDEQPDAVNHLLEIWNGPAEGPAVKLFLLPYMSGNPITRYLSQREEMFRARSARICERMANLLRERHSREAQLIEGVLKASNDRQAKKKSS